MRASPTDNLPRQQSGSTLIVTLIILILVMLLGVTAMTTSDMQYTLTGNLQFEDLALNNAETAIGVAERGLEANPLASTVPQNAASAVSALPDPLTGMSWTDADSTMVSDDTKRYVIGYVSTNPAPSAGLGLDCFDPANAHNYDCVNTFLITARGTSARGATKYVQTYYAVPVH